MNDINHESNEMWQDSADFLTLGQIQRASLDLLCEFTAICYANSLRYDIIGGSLLGAVRHQGFIPWDDDVDVSMPRPDYERMLGLLLGRQLELPARRGLISDRDETFARHYARYVREDIVRVAKYASDEDCPFLGIDIFPLDGVSGDDRVFADSVRQIEKKRRLLLLSTSKRGASSRGKAVALAKDIVRPFVKRYGSFRIARELDALCSQIPYDEAEFVGVITGMYGTRERWPKERMLPQATYMFEGKPVRGYKNYDEYLGNIYGDYMQLPPMEKRQPHFDRFAWA